jgi:hypothetical protein
MERTPLGFLLVAAGGFPGAVAGHGVGDAVALGGVAESA